MSRRKANAPFHIVFTTIYWSVNNITVGTSIVSHPFTTIGILLCQRVIGDPLLIESYSVSGREIKYHNVIPFYFAKTFQSLVFPLWFIDIGFAAYNGHCVLRQGKR